MKKIQRIALLSVIVLVAMIVFTNTIVMAEGVISTGVSYCTHVQNIGWQNYVPNGNVSGTSGKGLRLEAIKIKLENPEFPGEIMYSTHIQNIGWQNYVRDDEISGTSGRGYRLEAIKIKLVGEIEQYYDVYYRVHAQNIGWMNWAKNDEEAGTAGYGYRLEAIEILLLKKGGYPDHGLDGYFKAFADKSKKISVLYSTHIQNIGWQDYVTNGNMSGTSGKGLRLEAIKIELENKDFIGNIIYSTHIQNIGWQSYMSDGMTSGTSGKGYRLEAIKIRLTDELEKHYDVYYRVHAQNFGWMGWAKNDEEAGTSGYGYRLEAIEIVLIKKGNSPPSAAGDYNTPFSDVKERYQKQEQELINMIDGKYWYLEGQKYAYIKFEKKEWYDHYILDVETFGLKYIEEKIVVDNENWEWASSNEIYNMLMKNPIDIDYKLTRDYRMYIDNEKLYITINSIKYCFYKDNKDGRTKIAEDTKPYFLGEKNINITTDEDLYDVFYGYLPSFMSCNFDITVYPTDQDIIEFDLSFEKKKMSIHPVKPGSVSVIIKNTDNNQMDAVTINVEAGNKTKVEKIYCRRHYIQNFVWGFETVISDWSRWDNLATTQSSKNYLWLSVDVYPYTAINKRIIYSSSDESVVEITNEGKYITKKPGEAIITIQSEEDENIKNEIKVKVKKREIEVSLKANFYDGYQKIRIDFDARYGSYDYVKEIEIYQDEQLIKSIQDIQERSIIVNVGRYSGKYRIVGKVTDSDGDVVIKDFEMEYGST